MKHFEKLGTPLHSVLKYPSDHAQTQRFMAAGYSNIEVNSLWDLWSDPRFLSPSCRLALDEVEPFDEWEDFALFASHYCLVIAQTGYNTLFPQERGRRDSVTSVESELSARTASPPRPESQWFAYRYTQNPDGEARAHHASAFPPVEGSRDVLALHGGIGSQIRLSTTNLYASIGSDLTGTTTPPRDIAARSCHTVTALENGWNVLIGGRASPAAPFQDCWLQKNSTWERVHDLPYPLYRHRAAAVSLPNDTYGVVVFGGKTGASRVNPDPALLWDPNNGWQVLRSLRQAPKPRFGATFIRLGFNHGLMFGGMRQDGIICQGFWRWRLMLSSDGVAGIKFIKSTALDTTVGIYPWFNRLGASYSMIRNEVFIIGGIAKQGCIPKDYEILSMLGSFSAFGDQEREMDLRVSVVDPLMPPNCPRPLLIGHSSHRTHKEMTLIMGGGATCFSFGTYWNTGVWLFYDKEAGLSKPWALIKPEPPVPRVTDAVAARECAPGTSSIVQKTTIASPTDFDALLQASKPKIIASLDIGPCTSLWTPNHFKSVIAPTRCVIVHSATSRSMNFQRKDFAYTKMRFDDFITSVITPTNDSHIYLRSISSSNPTATPANLSTDWPEIAEDFRLPSSLDFITQNLHSSPLRIGGDVNMWLHYDVMANVYFQVYGSKKLVLFPPSDLIRLSFAPGSTTSSIDIFSSSVSDRSAADTLVSPTGTSPHIATLGPGDALFIPPLWAHAATPLASKPGTTPATIAVNVFFRSLSAAKYAAGRDVYGNRDLAAYEDGRRDVEKMARRFADGVPRDMAKTYLQRLADELAQKAAEMNTADEEAGPGSAGAHAPAASASKPPKASMDASKYYSQ